MFYRRRVANFERGDFVELKVGDVVIVTGPYEPPCRVDSLTNKIGVIRIFFDRDYAGVEMDEMFVGGHNLCGTLSSNRGWMIATTSLKKMVPLAELVKENFGKW